MPAPAGVKPSPARRFYSKGIKQAKQIKGLQVKSQAGMMQRWI
jgi:hypothetical protein